MKIKYAQIKELREQYVKEQNNICPILGVKLDDCDFVLDHNHKTGLIRGAISRCANAAEGKIKGAYIRTGCHNTTDPDTSDPEVINKNLIDFLRNLADYLESNKSTDNITHPSFHAKRRKKKTAVKKKKKLSDDIRC